MHAIDLERPATHPAPNLLHRGWQSAQRLLRTWRERSRMRRELAQWDARDIRDAGLSVHDVEYEASKPFWKPAQNLRG